VRVAVIGLGYVGCVTAACLAEAGHTVIGIDPVPQKVAAINEKSSPIVEPGLTELIAQNVDAGRLSAATDLDAVADVDLAIVSVGTPSTETGSLDLRYIERVAEELGGIIAGREAPLTIMLRSTVLPGTTRGTFVPILERVSGKTEGTDFFVCFTPEFLRESSAIADFLNPPFTIVGVESPAAAAVPEALLSFLPVPVQVVETGVAEGLKYASNAFHAVKVAFGNEIARITNATGVDGRKVMELFVQDRELNISPRYLRPGFAFGGSCLPKDVKALRAHAHELGVDAPLLDSLIPTNEEHIRQVVDQVQRAGITQVALLGLTFKKGTDDLRESPYLKVAAALEQAGISVKSFDPIIKPERLIGSNLAYAFTLFPSLEESLQPTIESTLDGAQAILLATNSAEVTDAVLAAAPVPVIDLSGMLSAAVENQLRSRTVHSPLAAYSGAAW